MKRSLLWAALLLLAVPLNTWAQTVVQVSWEPNTEEDLAGYRWYLVNRVNPIDLYAVGQLDTTVEQGTSSYILEFRVPGGAQYVLVMTAFDAAGNESGRSKAAVNRRNKVVYFKNTGAPKVPTLTPLTILKR